MTGLLRSGEAAHVRRFGAEITPRLEPDATAPLVARIAELESELEWARQELRSSEAEACAREVAARESGRRAVQIDEAARIEAISAAAHKAFEALKVGLVNLERLAGALSEIGLQKLFNEDGDRSRLVQSTIQAAVRRLRAGAAVKAIVSRSDFDGAARDALEAALAPLPVEIDDALESSEVRLELELGVLDLALDGQWDRLCDALRRLPEADDR